MGRTIKTSGNKGQPARNSRNLGNASSDFTPSADLSKFPPQMKIATSGVIGDMHWAVAEGPFSSSSYTQYNGYVAVPAGSPVWDTETEWGSFPVDVHGGITFNAEGVLGFDTAHYGDHVGYLEDRYGENVMTANMMGEMRPLKRWTLAEVEMETMSLAWQVQNIHDGTVSVDDVEDY